MTVEDSPPRNLPSGESAVAEQKSKGSIRGKECPNGILKQQVNTPAAKRKEPDLMRAAHYITGGMARK
jgi:hypothetical protein